MKFSKKELHDLLKAWFFISLAFAILFSGGYAVLLSLSSETMLAFLIAFLVSTFTVGISFLFHELSHKFLAQKYRLWAEFRSFDKMLWLALLFSLFGFVIAAPGAVVIRARFLSKEKNGKISLAGPLMNILLAFIFLILLFVMDVQGIFRLFLQYGFTINSLLALFNILPVPFFDGSKILKWNKAVYIVVAILALVLFVLSYAV